MPNPLLPSVQWSTNASLHEWAQDFAARLGANVSFLLRSFCVQLKVEDPLVAKNLQSIVELGLHEAIVHPKVVRCYLDDDLRQWLTTYLKELHHPKYPKRRVWLRHLMNGYMRWLQDFDERGGIVRAEYVLQEPPEGPPPC